MWSSLCWGAFFLYTACWEFYHEIVLNSVNPELQKQSWERERTKLEISLPDFEINYKATIIKIAWYLHKGLLADETG